MPRCRAAWATSTVEKLAHSKSGQVLSWCPSCYVQMTETTLPTLERQRGARPFDMTPFMRFLRARLDDLKPLLRNRVPMRVALHKHPGVAGVMEAAAEILRAIPGVELVDLHQPAVGLQSVNLAVLPHYKRELQLAELEAARAAGRRRAGRGLSFGSPRALRARARLAVPDRQCSGDLGASMGLAEHDRYKELKVTQDADLILAECRDMIACTRAQSRCRAGGRDQRDARRPALAAAGSNRIPVTARPPDHQ